jgi:hypothetical protein
MSQVDGCLSYSSCPPVNHFGEISGAQGGEYEYDSILEYFLVQSRKSGEPGSSVSIVSGYELDDRAIEVRSPAEARGFFL